MVKLISAKSAFALAFSTHNIDKALERINTEIAERAAKGYLKAYVKMTERREIVDVVVEELKKAGYGVHYSCIHPDYTLLRIEWMEIELAQ